MKSEQQHPPLGRFIESILLEKGMSKAEFGRRINTSRQNVSLILKRDRMDTIMLWRTSSVLEVDLFNVMSLCFSEGNPTDPGTRYAQRPTGKLDIRLELTDARLVHLTANLVRLIMEENRKGKGGADDPADAPLPVPK